MALVHMAGGYYDGLLIWLRGGGGPYPTPLLAILLPCMPGHLPECWPPSCSRAVYSAWMAVLLVTGRRQLRMPG